MAVLLTASLVAIYPIFIAVGFLRQNCKQNYILITVSRLPYDVAKIGRVITCAGVCDVRLSVFSVSVIILLTRPHHACLRNLLVFSALFENIRMLLGFSKINLFLQQL